MSFRFVPLAAGLAVVWLLAFGTAAWAGDEPAAEPTIYKWVDESGVAHYTTDRDRIPREIRTRVERVEPTRPAATAAPHREDLMRDAVKTQPPATIVAPAPAPVAPAPVAAVPPPNGAVPQADVDSDVGAEPSKPIEEVETVDRPVEEEIAAPLATDVEPEIDPVSAPPPAPVAALAPTQTAELSKLDAEIDAVEEQIAAREERLAVLISSSEAEHTSALVDDPSFREISQQLPKLQAELQTLRDRRNKIQPAAPTP